MSVQSRYTILFKSRLYYVPSVVIIYKKIISLHQIKYKKTKSNRTALIGTIQRYTKQPQKGTPSIQVPESQ